MTIKRNRIVRIFRRAVIAKEEWLGKDSPTEAIFALRRGLLRRSLLAMTVMILPGITFAAISGDLKPIDTEITEKQQEIAAINKKIAELDAKRSNTAAEADAIAIALERLKSTLRKAELELEKTTAAMQRVKVDQKETQQSTQELVQTISEKRTQLTSLLRQLYSFEQESFVRLLFDSQSLSDVLLQRNAYQILQQRAVHVISDMHDEEKKLQEQQVKLEAQADDLGELQTLLSAQKQELSSQKTQQNQFLQEKKEKQAQFEQRIVEAQAAREEIKQQIFTLESGKVKVSLKTAVDMAKFAGSVTGVRPSIIIAVLKVESGVGTNLGSGVFPDNMPLLKNRDAFLRITKKLGIDPYKTPLSRGGAMGPAQIMPTTWEGMEPRIAQLMKKQLVNPYELSDAFVATAIFLADRGAASPAKEAEALQRYVGGRYWESQSWYSAKVMAVAKEYEQQGL